MAATYSSPPPFSTSTNLGPITTTLSFPQDCYTDHHDFQTEGLGFPWKYTTAGCAISSCCPSGNIYSQPFAWMTSYYSPGLHCPSNYHSCAPPPSPYALSSSSGENIAFCCPSNYVCPAWQTQSGGGGIVYDGCNSGLVSGTQVVTVDNNIYDQRSMTQYTYTATGATTWWQIAWPIQIRWKERDLLATATTATTATSSITPTAGSNATQVSSGLSTGAIVGIVLGCLAALAFVLGTLCFLCLQRRRQRRLQPQPTVGISAGYGTGPGELPSDPSKQHVFQNSVSQPVFNELDAAPRQHVAEMQGVNSLEQTNRPNVSELPHAPYL